MTPLNDNILLTHSAPPPLAEYPHAKRLNHQLYLSGVSSRQPDGSRRGVSVSNLLSIVSHL